MERITKKIYIVRDKFAPTCIFGYFTDEKDAYHYIKNLFEIESTISTSLIKTKKEYLEVIPDIIISYN